MALVEARSAPWLNDEAHPKSAAWLTIATATTATSSTPRIGAAPRMHLYLVNVMGLASDTIGQSSVFSSASTNSSSELALA